MVGDAEHAIKITPEMIEAGAKVLRRELSAALGPTEELLVAKLVIESAWRVRFHENYEDD